jgi:PhoPQ-activated pathogenicity-related protein
MRKVRDFDACIAALRAVQGRNDTEPEQTHYIDDAIESLKQLRRKPNATHAETARFVREIAEALLSAFKK